MHILFYGNGGSGNHGCEAIVRGTVEWLGTREHTYLVHSACCREDAQYGLDRIAQIKPAESAKRRDGRFFRAYLKMKLRHDYTEMDGLSYLPQIQSSAPETEVALSVGGDNYCYGGTALYGYLNRAYHKAGVKTALWGCSIEPELVRQKELADDLRRYDLIVARESLTYEAVCKVNSNTVLAPDPAFFMQPQSGCGAQSRTGNCIGINLSPYILTCETNCGLAYQNYRELISYLLTRTDSESALIPHVGWERNDDRKVLRQLYESFGRHERLILVEDHPAPELKFLISQCRMFVGARTHATIAAYSSGVPTLAVGYSVKARGIARDLFGSEEHYVLPVQSLKRPEELTEAFCRLQDREAEIRARLQAVLPAYLASAEQAKCALEALR